MLQLTVLAGPDKGKSLRLHTGKAYTIGCNEDASLPLTDPLVLKDHCAIEVEEDSIVLRNQTATAGTFVGDKKIAQARLKAPIRFKVGDTVIGLTGKPLGKENAGRDLTGKIIGGYKLDEIVGRGGMGTVYRATQLSLHRDVAVKVLSQDLAKDKAFTGLFINEARAAAQLIHPNVVQVYDAGMEGDVSYFSMEFIGQGSVEEILERADGRKLPWEQAILWVLEAAHGLAFAESKGIVHRDVKPDNLMINDAGQCKIADLGLAKRGEGGQDQGIIGTPHFIPPEQALGKEVDGRADIYSLGATFFRMITGKTVFTGKSAKEIVLKHIKEPAPAASSIEKGVPDDLDLVMARMLAKEPDQRYANAQELIRALEEVCAHHGIKGSIIRKGVGKKVLIPLVLLLLVGAFVIYKLATKGTDPETLAREARLRAAQEAAEKRAQEEAARTAEQARLRRRTEAANELLRLENDYNRLRADVSMESVYDGDDAAAKAMREKRWLDLAGDFRGFAESDSATEFEEELQLATKADERADYIENRLKKVKASVKHRAEQIAAKVKEAQGIYQAQRGKLDDLRLGRQYNEMAHLCGIVGAEQPGKQDPFAPVVNWVYRYEDVESPAKEIPQIMAVVKEARDYFAKEHDAALSLAQKDWTKVLDEKVAPLDLETAADTEIEAAIQELEAVVESFPAPKSTPTAPEIKRITAEARDKSAELRRTLADRRERRLQEDRMLVSTRQRQLVSLRADIQPNLVMHCDFAGAIAAWQQTLRDLQTERYSAFVEERIRMLRWCEYLFACFHRDLALSASERDKEKRPLPELDLELPIPDSDRALDTELDDPTDNPYEFTTERSLKGERTFSFASYPMDWIHNAIFLHQGQPRWREVVPALRFALGAFCFETMQYAKAREHFEVLQGDEVHGAVARVLAERAAREEAAKQEWLAICAAAVSATSTAELARVREQANTFKARHEGTLFFLECMLQKTTLGKDFYDESAIRAWPAVPPAPEPPATD